MSRLVVLLATFALGCRGEHVGPATSTPAPVSCTQSSEPPIGGTSMATVRLEVAADARIGMFALRSLRPGQVTTVRVQRFHI